MKKLIAKLLLGVLFVLGAVGAQAQITYYSKAAATDFSSTASWGTNTDGSGSAPASITNADNYIIQNSSVLSLGSNASVRTLVMNAGTLNVSANTLNVGITGQKNSTFQLALATSVLNVSGGTINIDGALIQLTTGAIFNQSGGNINIDGNNAGSATNSYAGTALCQLTGSPSTVILTGGTITIIDPPAGATYALYGAMSTVTNATTGHTFAFGNGVSNDAGTSTNGFYTYLFPGSSYLVLGNVQLNSTAAPAANRYVLTTSTIGINGNLTIGTNGEYRAGSTTTLLAGNLVNNGTFITPSTTLVFGSFATAVTGPSTLSQSISGTGVFANNTTLASSTANFGSLTFNNTSSGGVTFSNANSLLCITGGVTNTGTVSGTLTFSACPNGVDLNTGTFIQGVSTATPGSTSWTSGGFKNGNFKKWFGTATLTSTLPSTTVGNFPFTTGGANRNFQVAASTAPTAGGSITVSHNPANNFSTVVGIDPSGGYVFNRLSNASWTASTADGLSGGTYLTNASGDGLMLLTSIASEPRLVQSAVAGVGTHVAPTGSVTSPVANRNAFTLANLANSFALGINNTNTAGIFSVQTGAWDDGTTWSTGVAPLSTDAVTVMAGHTVTVNAVAAVAGLLTVNGTLNVSGSTLNITATTTGTGVTMGTAGTVNINGGAMTVGTGANRFSTFATGTALTSVLNMSSGSLTINGNLNIQSPSTFTQSGGTINVDGNAVGVAANSVPSGTAIVNIASANLNLTGGILIILDPHANTTSPSSTTNRAFAYTNASNYNAGISHTLQFGDGASTDAGGFTSGFVINTFVSSGRLALGNLSVNGSATGTNRLVTAIFSMGITGNLTTSGATGEFSLGGLQINVAGNVTNNGVLTAASGGVLALQNFLSGTATPATTAQTVSGTGTFRNLATSPTANFNSITINNTNASGVTFSGALWNSIANATVSGTLTFTAGLLNTSGGVLTLGVSAAAAGTLSYIAGGFTAGSSFTRWFPTAAITIGSSAGQFPFVNAASQARHAFFGGVAAITGGWVNLQYNDVAGTTAVAIADLFQVAVRSNSNWVVTTGGGLAITSSDAQMRFRGDGIFSLATTANFLPVAAAAPANGTSILGSGTTSAPEANKTTLSTAGLSQTIYVGTTNVINSTVVGGAWESTGTWVGGVVPGCFDLATIVSGATVTVNAVASSVGFVNVNAGGTLTVSGSTLTVGCINNNASLANNGTLNVSAGNLIVNGNLAINNASTFNHSGGTITIDGNNNSGTVGNAASVGSGTPLFAIGTSGTAYGATGTVTLSGGTIIITDPHVGSATNTSGYAVYANMSASVFANASTSHTFQFGDAVSTGAGGHTSGFYVSPFAGSGRLNFGNVTLNSAAGTNRNVVQTGTSVINGNFIGTLGTYDQGSSTTNIGGNINIGTGSSFITGGTVVFASVTGTTTSAQTTAQGVTVSGTGTILNLSASATANFTSVTVNNTSSTGVTFNTLNAIAGQPASSSSVSGTLNFTAGKITTAPGNRMILGTSVPAAGTLTVTAGGFASGSTYGRWSTVAGTGSTITAGADPSSTTSRFPFLDASGNNRSIWLQRVTPSAAGVYAVTYNDAATLSTVSIVDGAYTVQTRYDGNWTFSTLGTAPAAATYTVASVAPSAYFAANGNSRIILAGAAVGGTHQNGTITPGAQRTGLTLAQLTAGALYMGIANVDIPFASVANGNWENGTTWNKNPAVPIATDAVVIANGTTVTVNAAASVANAVTVNSGGILTVSGSTLGITTALTNSGTVNVSGGNLTTTTTLTNNASSTINVSSGLLTVTTTMTNTGTFNATGGTTLVTATSSTGITNSATTGLFIVNGGIINLGITDNTSCNRTFTNNGTLTVSSGTLNIYGNFVGASGSTFNQSGGDINLDGNGTVNSVASGTVLFALNSNLGTVNGGTLTIVDPPSTGTAKSFAYSSSSNTWPGHTLKFGNGVSSDASANTNGFEFDCFVGSGYLLLGNLTVDAGSATNRWVSTASAGDESDVGGNVTITSGSELRNAPSGAGFLVGGNILNNGTLTTSTIIYLGSLTGSTFVPSTNAQTISGTGTFRNATSGSTASMTNLQVYNSNASGVTFAAGLSPSFSGTLTVTDGKLNSPSLSFNGITTQSAALAAATSVITVANVTLNNSVTFSGAGMMNVTGVLNFGNVTTKTLTTGGIITLKSTATNTARVADITNAGINPGNSISGNVTVERFIPARRAWKLLTAPVRNAGSIYTNWQNGGTPSGSTGVNIWGPGGGTPPATIAGLYAGANNSMRQYNVATNLWSSVTNTTTAGSLSSNVGGSVADNKSFILFVTNPFDAAGTNITPAGSAATTLRATGSLQQGDQTFAVGAYNAVTNQYALVGNPYASPVDFTGLITLATNATAIEDRFWIVDPTLSTVGAYQLVYNSGGGAYKIAPAPYTGGPAAGDYVHLQSGQAVFVEPKAAGTGTLTFRETYKSTPATSPPVFLLPPRALAVNMYNGTQMLDGSVMLYDNNYATAIVAAEDVKKIYNDGPNVAIARNNTGYIIEARPDITSKDTSFLWVSNIQANQTYRFSFKADRFDPLVSAWLEDAFTNGRTAIDLSGAINDISFSTTTDPASRHFARFRIVYQLAVSQPPVSFVDVKASLQNTASKVEWTVSGELNVDHYEVEYSTNGTSFTKLGQVLASGNNGGSVSYSYLHMAPVTGINYYRIKLIEVSGNIKYSFIVNVVIDSKGGPGIVVYPNPAVAKDAALQLRNLPAGKYDLVLITSGGQIVHTQQLVHSGGTAALSMNLPVNMAPGMYRVVLYSADKTKYKSTLTITGN